MKLPQSVHRPDYTATAGKKSQNPRRSSTRGRGYRKEWQGRDGRWRVRVGVFLSQDPLTGKQRTKWDTKVADTLSDAHLEADKFVADTRDAFKKGTLTEPCKDSLAVWGRRWLESRKGHVKRSTWEGYSTLFRTRIEAPTDEAMPHIGHFTMERLRQEHVLKLYTYLTQTPNRREHVNAGRAKALHAVLRQVFRAAFNTDALVVDLLAKLRGVLPRQKRKRPKAFTGEQVMAFLQAADGDPYRAFWYLFVTTGARPGELLALRWPAVDLASRTIHITETLHRVPRVPDDQRWEFTEAKTENANRVVAFPSELVPILEQQRKQQRAAVAKAKLAGRECDERYADLVFTTSHAQPVDWINLTDHYRRICRQAGLGTFGPQPEKPEGRHGPAKQPTFTPLLSPYHLRHTNATVSRDDGVPMHVISARLGHYKKSFTDDTYVDERMEGQQLATASWSKRLQQLRETGTGV